MGCDDVGTLVGAAVGWLLSLGTFAAARLSLARYPIAQRLRGFALSLR